MSTKPSPTPSDEDLSARQHIDLLMRRVVLMLIAAGEVAMLTMWGMEWRSGTLDATNAVAYPVMVVVNLVCLGALWRWPRFLLVVRWVGFLSVTLVLFTEFVQQVTSGLPMISNYNAVSLLNWLPLCYALAFFLLEDRPAAWATALMLGFVATMATWRGLQVDAWAAADRDLLANTLVSHAVLVVCLTGMIWLKRVVTSQGEQAVQLRLLAGTDPLTGLANRRQTLRQLERLVGDRRAQSSPAVLLADIDHFKRINDTCGHEMGDRVLVEVAAALRAQTRDGDTVARWGGEEFLVVLPRTRAGEAGELAERLRTRIESLAILDAAGEPVRITLSLGVASLGERDGVASWLRRADEALYRAKSAGRNRWDEALDGAAPDPAAPRRAMAGVGER